MISSIIKMNKIIISTICQLIYLNTIYMKTGIDFILFLVLGIIMLVCSIYLINIDYTESNVDEPKYVILLFMGFIISMIITLILYYQNQFC
jgi:hypothetical protein